MTLPLPLLFEGADLLNLTGAGAVTLVVRRSFRGAALGGSDCVIILLVTSDSKSFWISGVLTREVVDMDSLLPEEHEPPVLATLVEDTG